MCKLKNHKLGMKKLKYFFAVHTFSMFLTLDSTCPDSSFVNLT